MFLIVRKYNMFSLHYISSSHKHKSFFSYNNNFIFIEKNAVDSILDPPLLPHKRQLNFESGLLNENETKQPAAKRKRKLIQKSHIKVAIKVPYNYLVH